MPDGSVWNRWGLPSKSNPAMRHEIPKGRLPLLWVYFCFIAALVRQWYKDIRNIKYIKICSDWSNFDSSSKETYLASHSYLQYSEWYIPKWQDPPQWVCETGILFVLGWWEFLHQQSDLNDKIIEIIRHWIRGTVIEKFPLTLKTTRFKKEIW